MRHLTFLIGVATILLAPLQALATPQKPHLFVLVTPSPAHPGETVVVSVKATIPKGTHLYAVHGVGENFTATELSVSGEGLTLQGTVQEPKTHPFRDPSVNQEVGTHEGEVTFSQALGVPASYAPGTVGLKVALRYQACDETGCLPPKTEELAAPTLQIEAGAIRPEFTQQAPSPNPPAPSDAAGLGSGLAGFLATAFGAGLLALLTPCVFPMVPVTFAYFTKLATAKGEDLATAQKTVVKLAVLYCLGIVVSFTLFGLVTALTVGAAGATRFAANPVVNVGFGLIFIGFGLALLEVFELKLPSNIQQLTGAGRKTGGMLGVFLLGLTFVIVSFTCAAPFVGTVMVLAAKGGEPMRAVLGMALFATALALPFFLLALFPSLLKKLPKSGDWLTTVKGVMGFLEIAAAVKFFSNADLVWNWNLITVPLSLALYATIFLGCGLWLLGKLHLGFNTPQGTPTKPRRIWAGLFVAAALYSYYGSAGRPLHPLLSGFLPPADHTGFGTRHGENDLEWVRDLDKAKSEAKKTGKRIVIDFTGHTCTNCRDVETRVFSNSVVKTELEKLVRVRLYTDGGKYATSEEGKRNAELALKLFDNLVNPLYAVIDADGKLIAKADYNLAKDPTRMAQWLQQARG